MCHLNVPLPMYLLCFVSVFEYYYFSFFKRFSFSIFSSEYSRTCVPTCWVEKSCNNVVGLFVCCLLLFYISLIIYDTVRLLNLPVIQRLTIFPIFNTFLIHIFRSTFLLKLDSSDQTSSKHCVIMKYFDSLKLSLFFQTIGTKISAKS